MNIANIIIALVVPFVSVLLAQQMTRRAAKRTMAMQYLLKLNRDLVDYLQVASDYRYRRKYADACEGPNWQQLRDEMPQTERRLFECVASLDDDRYALGLIFGRKVDDVGKRVRMVAETALKLVSGEMPTDEEMIKGFSDRVSEIKEKMRILWDSLSDVGDFE